MYWIFRNHNAVKAWKIQKVPMLFFQSWRNLRSTRDGNLVSFCHLIEISLLTGSMSSNTYIPNHMISKPTVIKKIFYCCKNNQPFFHSISFWEPLCDPSFNHLILLMKANHKLLRWDIYKLVRFSRVCMCSFCTHSKQISTKLWKTCFALIIYWISRWLSFWGRRG